MPQFQTLPSHRRGGDVIEEPLADEISSLLPPIALSPGMRTAHLTRPLYPTSNRPTPPVGVQTAPFTQPLPSQTKQLTPTTGQLSPFIGMVHEVPTTQAFVSPLQVSTSGASAKDRVVVIPGNKKYTRVLPETAQVPKPRMKKRIRHGIALGTILFVLLLTMISLVPLDDGQSTYHLLGGAIQWASSQQQKWNVIPHQAGLDDTTHAQVVPAVSAPPITLPTNQYVAIARQDALDAGIPPDAFVRQIYQESGFNPGARSPVGAVGIAQFMPDTAAGMGIDPYDPVQALRGAAKLMASYNNQYGGDYAKALAAYNAGPGNVQIAVSSCGGAWLSCTPAETQNYVRIIMGW